MTTTYTFPVIYTRLGIAAAPLSAPTVQIVDKDNNILVTALTAVTAVSNMPGAYYYAYTGADNLVLWALFHTSDTTVDQQDLGSYTPAQTYTNKLNIATILADYARRTGDYAVAGDAMDLIATLKHIAGSSGYDRTTDSLEAVGARATNLDAAISTRSSHTAADVWSVATRTLTSFGTLIADIWAYATRTLTQTAASIAAAISGDTITVIRGDTMSVSLTGLGSLADNIKVYFTVKNHEADADSASTLMVEKTDGLKYINGAAAVTAGNGTLVIDDEPTGNITITVAAVEIAKLGLGSYVYDVQIVRSSGIPVTTLAKGSFIVTDDITRAVS